jgi:hypothetical protein
MTRRRDLWLWLVAFALVASVFLALIIWTAWDYSHSGPSGD